MSNQHYSPLYVPDPVLAFESRYTRAREPGAANPFRGLEQEVFDASSLRSGSANLRQPNRSSESTGDGEVYQTYRRRGSDQDSRRPTGPRDDLSSSNDYGQPSPPVTSAHASHLPSNSRRATEALRHVETRPQRSPDDPDLFTPRHTPGRPDVDLDYEDLPNPHAEPPPVSNAAWSVPSYRGSVRTQPQGQSFLDTLPSDYLSFSDTASLPGGQSMLSPTHGSRSSSGGTRRNMPSSFGSGLSNASFSSGTPSRAGSHTSGLSATPYQSSRPSWTGTAQEPSFSGLFPDAGSPFAGSSSGPSYETPGYSHSYSGNPSAGPSRRRRN